MVKYEASIMRIVLIWKILGWVKRLWYLSCAHPCSKLFLAVNHPFFGVYIPAGQRGNEKSPSDGERDFLPLDYLKPISTSNNTNGGRCWVDLNFDFGFMTVSGFGMDGSQVETQVHADFW